MARDKIAVAMSGGVDSSVVAYMLKEQGYDICGITMVISNSANSEKEKKTVKDAKLVANFLGIEHHVINLRKEFYETVIKQFLTEYENGRTPNPCVTCNKYIKFGALLNHAKVLGYNKIATGHYVIQKYNNESKQHEVYRADDESKDQTYMMYNLNQQILQHTMFPLGDYSKTKVRELAFNWNLPIASKGESQEICFIDDNDYKKYWQENTNKTGIAGDLLDTKGNKIGRHNGIQNYTIGQRKGLGVALGHPAYVTKINSKNHSVTIGKNENLFKTKLSVNNVNWLAGEHPLNNEILVKIRYRSKPEPAKIIKFIAKKVVIEFNEPQRAITPGQSAVFYSGKRLIGGGVIE
ncbi:tRNA 2-thiouridine(34) synthase MnmA [Clostridium sp. 'deep sea']|uniref:tRNA 2-thiouridine(34) synthase MnmA n=1 Tax=Clostridium sp. 'deep sea' TaxID=2779445 RepID=UPI00189663EB|nr:tRNA 2-thiouridine(34) synthase MnmA [Clostridium sp. 'deep sea']QOR35696.1 tRNA 2-thiouridine(34) synthase MnmA [Clostridium sp. 'deep sea']